MKKINYSFLLLAITLIVISSTNSFAGTDGAELNTAYEKLSGLIGGTGGKLIMGGSLITALVAWAQKANPLVIGTPIFIGIATAVATGVIDATVTSLLTF
jgi:hypothetical protein